MTRRERFARLYRDNHHRVLGYALRRIERREDAEDVVADTFAVAWRRLDEIPDKAARAWLYGVARKALANQRRGDARRGRLLERLLSTREDHHAAPAVDRAGPAAQAFMRLSPVDREALALLCWEELSPAEIAVALGCTPNAARIRVHRARRRLARMLEQDATETPSPVAQPEGDEA